MVMMMLLMIINFIDQFNYFLPNSNVQEVRDCIEATSQDCPFAMKALLKKLIEGYQTVSLEDNCVIIPQIIGDQDFTGYTCQINIFKDESGMLKVIPWYDI